MTAAAVRTKLNCSRFLQWSKDQGKRHELADGELVEMAEEKAKHALMKHAAAKALEAGIASAALDCTVFPDGMSVVIGDAHVRRPDAAVQCGSIDPESVVLDRPVVLVEVTSPSSAGRDESEKLIEYFSVASVAHYLLLSPEQRTVVHFRRADGSGRFEARILSEGRIDLTPPGFSVDAADLLGRVPATRTARS